MIISWSLLRAFEQCPYQQKLIRIDKVGPKRIDERRFITGSVGHKFFEIWAKRGFDDEINPAAAGRIFDKLIHRKFIRWHNESDCDETRERVIKEASLLIEAVRHNGIDKINDAQIECFLLTPLPDGRNSIGGIIDLIANNGSWIIELKMSADLKWADPDQLIFYGLLLASIQRRYPQRLSFFLPLLSKRENCLMDITFEKKSFLKIYARIRNLIESWNNGYFQAKGNAEACNCCDVIHHLSTGQVIGNRQICSELSSNHFFTTRNL